MKSLRETRLNEMDEFRRLLRILRNGRGGVRCTIEIASLNFRTAMIQRGIEIASDSSLAASGETQDTRRFMNVGHAQVRLVC